MDKYFVFVEYSATGFGINTLYFIVPIPHKSFSLMVVKHGLEKWYHLMVSQCLFVYHRQHICSIVCNSASVCVQWEGFLNKPVQPTSQHTHCCFYSGSRSKLLATQFSLTLPACFFLFFVFLWESQRTFWYKPKPYTMPTLFIAWLCVVSAFLEVMQVCSDVVLPL
ncbi:hypothetical protein XENORESO_020034 [Xenotaenia resolanae]|uniref:Uncharacterized protein n=1 Tax=Xenotaenia resolanae TaxID=208358 RepID=A0ABV0WZL2_9TELE